MAFSIGQRQRPITGFIVEDHRAHRERAKIAISRAIATLILKQHSKVGLSISSQKVIDYAKSLMEKGHLEFIETDNYIDALELLAERVEDFAKMPFDMIYIDGNLPGYHGENACNAGNAVLKEKRQMLKDSRDSANNEAFKATLRHWQGIPIFYVTAFDDLKIRAEMLDGGRIIYYVAKDAMEHNLYNAIIERFYIDQDDAFETRLREMLIEHNAYLEDAVQGVEEVQYFGDFAAKNTKVYRVKLPKELASDDCLADFIEILPDRGNKFFQQSIHLMELLVKDAAADGPGISHDNAKAVGFSSSKDSFNNALGRLRRYLERCNLLPLSTDYAIEKLNTEDPLRYQLQSPINEND